MGIAFGRPDRKSREGGDLGESQVERVLQRHHGRLCLRQLREAAAKLPPRLGAGDRSEGVAVAGGALVGGERLGSAHGPRLRVVLAGVDDEPVQPGRELRLAAELPDPDHKLGERLLRGVARILRVAEQVERQPLDPRRMALAERGERAAVARPSARHEDRVGEPFIDERTVATLSRLAAIGRWTALLGAGLQDVLTLVGMALVPELVLPRLRGSFGRVYLHAFETPSTQSMAPAQALHGTVAVAEHQTRGRGRLGRVWVDEPGTGLAMSVVLRPPPPVARWPEVTLLAAEAVAGAIGEGATIKDPNDVLLDGRKVAGILAEAGEHIVLGIGVNVGQSPWPDAGHVERDRLELLVEILERLEQGYRRWVSTLAAEPDGPKSPPQVSALPRPG